jgi:SAM-dependent methyltransferase
VEQKGEPVQSSGWQVRNQAAEVYERCLVPAIFAPWAQRLVDVAGIGTGERVLDAACGTGVVARRSAARVGPTGFVAGVDVNAGMIAVARSIPADAGPAIAWHEADVQQLPFPDSGFDVVICQFGLMYVSDRPAALAELRRVIAPGGRIILAVWRSLACNPGWSLFVTALEQHVGVGAADTMRKPFGLGADEVRDLVMAAGFGEVRVRIDGEMTRFPSPGHLVRWQAAGSPLASAFDALPAESVDAMVAGVAGLLRPYTDDYGIAFPGAAYVVTARAPRR